MRDLNASSAEGHKELIVSAEAKRKEHERLAADAGEKVVAARDRLARLARGETVAGGFGKKLDVVAMMRATGFTPRQMKRMASLASRTEEEFSTLLRNADTPAAADRAVDRALRRLMRERREP